MSLADIIIEHCQQQRDGLKRSIHLLETGKMKTGENQGGGPVDTTEKSLEANKTLLSELDRIEAEAKAWKKKNPT